jgi:putative transposase
MRFTAHEKREIIRLVEGSDLPVRRTIKELGISKSSFYSWYSEYLDRGLSGLEPKRRNRKDYWNLIPDEKRQEVIIKALESPDLSPRELSVRIIDEDHWYVSESSV